MKMRTMTAQLQVQNIADTDIYYPKETLVPSFELALIEYLNSNNRRVLHDAAAAKVRR